MHEADRKQVEMIKAYLAAYVPDRPYGRPPRPPLTIVREGATGKQRGRLHVGRCHFDVRLVGRTA